MPRFIPTDANLGNRRDPNQGAGLLGYVPPFTGKVNGQAVKVAGRSISAKLSEVVSVKDFGAVGDGRTDDTEAIQRAIDYVVSTGKHGLVRFPANQVYKITRTINIDVSFVSLLGNGSTLDFSSMTSGTAVSLFGSRSNGQDPGLYEQASSVIERLDFKGPGSSTSVIGLKFHTSVAGAYGSAHQTIRSCSIRRFGTGIHIEDHGYIQTFSGCFIYSCNVGVLTVAGASDSGERITFMNSTIANNNTAFDLNNVNADVYLTVCSIDYCTVFVDVSGGRFTMLGGHVEGNADTDYWLKVAGDGVLARFIGVDFVITVNKSSYELGTVNSNVKFGGIELTNCFYTATGYSLQNFFAGAGRVFARGFSCYDFSPKFTIAESCNLLADGNFARGNLSEFTLSGGTSPVYDGTETHTADGSGSAKMAVASDNTNSQMLATFDVYPGQRPMLTFWYKTSNLSGHGSFIIRDRYLDRGGNQLYSAEESITTDAASWTRHNMTYHGVHLAPKGAVTLEIMLFGYQIDIGTSIWVDDININLV